MPHAGLSRLRFCPPRVPIGPRCPRVGFFRPGFGLLLLASAGPNIGFSIRPLQAQLQFSWCLLPMGANIIMWVLLGPAHASQRPPGLSSCLPSASPEGPASASVLAASQGLDPPPGHTYGPKFCPRQPLFLFFLFKRWSFALVSQAWVQ